jgi:putative Holliday junction resolvase
MRPGRRLAVDVGRVRIGLAICDAEGILASPLDAISRSHDVTSALAGIADLIASHQIIEVYVGEPLSLNGAATESTNDARQVAIAISERVDVPVRMIDERLTTVTAAAKLRLAGHTAKSSKSIIDSASAVEILEIALSYEKSSGTNPGNLVGDRIGA